LGLASSAIHVPLKRYLVTWTRGNGALSAGNPFEPQIQVEYLEEPPPQQQRSFVTQYDTDTGTVIHVGGGVHILSLDMFETLSAPSIARAGYYEFQPSGSSELFLRSHAPVVRALDPALRERGASRKREETVRSPHRLLALRAALQARDGDWDGVFRS